MMEVQVERVGLEGQGVAYDLERNIYFVPGGLPGDLAEVEVLKKSGRYRDTRLVQIVSPSPKRVESPCQYFSVCGGCDYLDWDYQSQLSAKEDSLKHVLDRAQWKVEEWLAMAPAASLSGYRNRIQVRSSEGKLGFYGRRSHDIVDIDSCYVAHPKLNEALKSLRDNPLVLDSETHQWELGFGQDGEVLLTQDLARGAQGFAQINEAQNELLKSSVSKILESISARNVLELYCGNGNLTFGYLDKVSKVIAYDHNETAITAARELRRQEDEKKAAFFVGEVTRDWKNNLPEDFANHYDTLLVDPPRSGMGENVLVDLITPELKAIVYVSCSPVTFSKDIQCLKSQFTLQSVLPIDMFPHTKHIELVALFLRSSY